MIRSVLLALALSTVSASAMDAEQIEMKAYIRMTIAAAECGIPLHPAMGQGVYNISRKYHMDPMETARHIDEAAWREARSLTTRQIIEICENVARVYRRM